MEQGFEPRARRVPEHLRESLERQLAAVAIRSETQIKDAKALFITRWQPLIKRFAGDHKLQLLYTPLHITLRCFTAIVIASARGFAQGFLLMGAHSVHVAFLAIVMPYKNRLRNIKQLAVASLHAFVILLCRHVKGRGDGADCGGDGGGGDGGLRGVGDCGGGSDLWCGAALSARTSEPPRRTSQRTSSRWCRDPCIPSGFNTQNT